MDKNSTELGKIAPSDITPHRKYVSRRALLAGAIGLAAAQTIGRFGGNAFGGATIGQSAPATLTYLRNAAMSVTDTPNSYKDISTHNNYYEFGTDKSDPAENAQEFRNHLTSPSACWRC